MIKTALAIVCGFAVVTASVLGIHYVNDRQSAFDSDFLDLVRPVVYYALMLVGTFASERYKFFTGDQTAGRNFFANISYSYLYRSLLVSPLVFAAVVTFLGKDANVIMAAIFSFQNGFFWETVFNTKISASAAAALVLKG